MQRLAPTQHTVPGNLHYNKRLKFETIHGYGLPLWLNSKEYTYQAGNAGLIPEWGKIPLKEEMAIHSGILV